jgi:hypothetical protein
VQFEVNDTMVAIKEDPLFRGSVFGIVSIFSQSDATYQAVNVPGGLVKVVDGQTEAVPSKGTISVPSSQSVGFRVKYGGYPLGEVQAAPTGAPIIYFSLAMPQPTGGKRGAVISKGAQPPQTSAPVDEQQRQSQEKDKQEKDRQEKEKKAREEQAQKALEKFNGVAK